MVDETNKHLLVEMCDLNIPCYPEKYRIKTYAIMNHPINIIDKPY